MAATVSPTIVSAMQSSSNTNGNIVTHPRVTEIQSKGIAGSAPVKLRRQLPGSIPVVGNVVSDVTGLGFLAGPQPNPPSNVAPNNEQPSNGVVPDSVPVDTPVAQNISDAPATVGETAGNTVANTPVGQNAAPVEPAAPASPYAGSNVATKSKSKSKSKSNPTNSGGRKTRVGGQGRGKRSVKTLVHTAEKSESFHKVWLCHHC